MKQVEIRSYSVGGCYGYSCDHVTENVNKFINDNNYSLISCSTVVNNSNNTIYVTIVYDNNKPNPFELPLNKKIPFYD